MLLARFDQYSITEARKGKMDSYVIWRHGSGFFSIVAGVLGKLHLADDLGAVPYIDLETHPTPYQQENPIRGSRNVWDYYFQPVSNISREEAFSNNVHNPGGEYPPEVPYSMVKSPIFRLMWDKYVRINTSAAREIKALGTVSSAGPKLLGVHFRGQEMRTAAGHPLPPTIKQMVGASKQILDSEEFDNIFLVTEASQYIAPFRRAFGPRLTVSPTFRMHFRNSYAVQKEPRANHRYWLGLETLNDALTLAQCGGVLGSYSNLTDAGEVLGGTHQRFVGRIYNGKNVRPKGFRHLNWYLKAGSPSRLGGFENWKEALQTSAPHHPESSPQSKLG
jgi:hypothetical protein